MIDSRYDEWKGLKFSIAMKDFCYVGWDRKITYNSFSILFVDFSGVK